MCGSKRKEVNIMPDKKSHNEFIEEMAQNKPDIEVLGQYTSARSKILCRCKKCGFEWSVMASSVLHKKGCPKCGKSLKLSHEEFVNRIKDIDPNIIILSTYKNSASKVLVQCKLCGQTWNARAGHLLQGHGCKRCKIKETKKDYCNDIYLRYLIDNFPQISIVSEIPKSINSKTVIACVCKECGHQWSTTTSHFYYSHNGCPKCTKQENILQQRLTYDTVIGRINKYNPNIEIISEYIDTKSYVTCRCKNDGYIWQALPSNLMRNRGCPVCSNKVVVSGINDLATTNPEVIEWLQDKDVAKLVCAGSTQKIDIECPNCHEKRRVRVRELIHSTGCPHCKINSYPNMFSYALLDQLPVKNIIHEFSPDWANRRRYDNYFEYRGSKYVLEMDGGFHYSDNSLSGQTVEESQKIDKYKDELASQHDITVIRIECKKSEKNYIFANIQNSLLNELFDLSNIDLEKCDMFARQRENILQTIKK